MKRQDSLSDGLLEKRGIGSGTYCLGCILVFRCCGLCVKRVSLSKELTLHVGAGTFRPVKSETIGEHDMHTEHISVRREVVEHLYAHPEMLLPWERLRFVLWKVCTGWG